MREGGSPRFFVPGVHQPGSRVAIGGQDARHILRVLRLGPGDEIRAVDSAGVERSGVIATVRPDEVLVVLAEGSDTCREPSVFITIVQGLPKGDKMDEIVRKNTELGVSRFVPVVTERTVARPDRAGAARRVERWRRIAREASRQSGRQRVPDVLDMSRFDEALRSLCSVRASGESAPCAELVLMPWEVEKARSIRAVLRGGAAACDVVVLIGPEGGFSRDEVERAVAHGAVTCGLGPRILRTETAGLVVASIILYEAGEME